MVYNDLDHALKNCTHSDFRNSKQLYFSKVDMMAALRQLPGRPDHFKWLIMKAQDPKSGKVYYFFNKCILFGASHSCLLYQEFSNSLKHIVKKLWTGSGTLRTTNFLDDFLFVHDSRCTCNAMVRHFLNICKNLNCPVSVEKTVMG